MSTEEPEIDFFMAVRSSDDFEALCKWFKRVGFSIPAERYCEIQFSVNLEEPFYAMLN